MDTNKPNTGRTGQASFTAPTPTGQWQPEKGELASDAEHAVDKAKETGEQVVSNLQQQAKSALSEQKGHVAEELGSVAKALRETSQNLGDQDQEAIAKYINKAAEGVEQFSNNLRDLEINQLLNDAKNFARRKPALFVGGAFTLGLLAARFFKSSAPSDNEMYTGEYERLYGQSAMPTGNPTPSVRGTSTFDSEATIPAWRRSDAG